MKPYIFKNDDPELDFSLTLEFIDKNKRFGLWFDKNKEAGWYFVSKHELENSDDINEDCGELSIEWMEILYQELGRILNKKEVL